MEAETIKENFKTVFNRLEALERKMDGNGRPGLTERLASLERATALNTKILMAILAAVVGIVAQLIRDGAA
ncbi:MAG: hypothetical protein IJ783_04915 [Kiritimatiellae bacterium]|nr:hypothetical protein [Kiritimatiellia bacterium]